MLDFIQLLKNRYLTLITYQVSDDTQVTIYQQRIEQLILAESFLKKGQLISTHSERALQVAVIGPTQVGKSSIVNLLLNNTIAGVSALAGYTVHPQGFLAGVSDQDHQWIEAHFGGFRRVEMKDLNAQDYNAYSLMPADKTPPTPLPDCLLWDLPDFDSIDATGYREGVLTTVGLADVVVLVVSKEKYADQSVWEMMALLEPLNLPTIIIVNKLVADSQQVVLSSLTDKWRQARKDAVPAIIPLNYQSSGRLESWPQAEFEGARRAFIEAVSQRKPSEQSSFEKAYLNQHWKGWLAPIREEETALKTWRQLLDHAVKEALAQYERDYLEHPHHYDTFQNAMLELLTLLEIPGLAKVLSKIRRILTWPVRQVLRLGRFGKRNSDEADISQEINLLNQKAEHFLIKISEKIIDQIDDEPERAQWWKEMNAIMRSNRQAIMDGFGQAVLVYHEEFQGEVERIAQRLYRKLQEQPAVLNSLRATRLTTDSAAIALAIKTGGIGLQDLLITPLMLSVTSLLTESVLGGYIGRLEMELKQKQLATVKQQLFLEAMKVPMAKFPEQMEQNKRFNVSLDRVEQAEQQLKEKKHGLRLF
ncbi:MAG TPA: GTP-binding protein [Methylococcaceae bacterium]|nr:GTP-binding protein [Methylococcaceae bacterium]HIA45340.1 GTP-binding protein [Methylococcaceae bacterium]HIB61716.1 GTP-binding protein [Methylococcaceae bacterium]HIN68443.1 GTP-binding protein [Methylococcales bacterium]HIO44201.1 GTP-binding protein [Methylococcales bacterium]